MLVMVILFILGKDKRVVVECRAWTSTAMNLKGDSSYTLFFLARVSREKNLPFIILSFFLALVLWNFGEMIRRVLAAQ